jgi:hypothetical protein
MPADLQEFHYRMQIGIQQAPLLADCMATWLASFIDTPTSAWVRAGASFMPSPIIMVLPFLLDTYQPTFSLFSGSIS